METALPPEPKSYLLPLILALVVVMSGSLYYYLRLTSPDLVAGFSNTLSSSLAKLRPAPSASPKSEVDASSTIASNQSPAPTPTPIPYVLPSGLQTYRFSNGKDVKGPKINTLTLDPFDPQAHATQTFTLELESDSPITNAKIIAITDHEENTINLSLASGNSQKGVYSGSWQVNDSYTQIYNLEYVLTNSSDTNDSVMHLR